MSLCEIMQIHQSSAIFEKHLIKNRRHTLAQVLTKNIKQYITHCTITSQYSNTSSAILFKGFALELLLFKLPFHFYQVENL